MRDSVYDNNARRSINIVLLLSIFGKFCLHKRNGADVFFCLHFAWRQTFLRVIFVIILRWSFFFPSPSNQETTFFGILFDEMKCLLTQHKRTLFSWIYFGAGYGTLKYNKQTNLQTNLKFCRNYSFFFSLGFG